MLKDKSLLEDFDLVKELDGQAAQAINGGAFAGLAAALDSTWGWSRGYQTREGAKYRALYECERRYKGTNGCMFMWRGDSDCGAIAKLINTLYSGRGSTRAAAEQDALMRCGSSNCTLIGSVCA